MHVRLLAQALEEEAAKAAAAAAKAAAAKAARAAAAAALPGAHGVSSPAPESSAGQGVTAAVVAQRPPLPMASEEEVAGGGGLGLEASRAVWKALVGVWGDGLPAVVQRGLQLCLLLLERYALWARDWADYLDARLRAPPAERDAEPGGGGRRGDEELRVLGWLAGDCSVLAHGAVSEVAAAVEAALLLVHRSEAAARPSMELVRTALAGAAGTARGGGAAGRARCASRMRGAAAATKDGIRVRCAGRRRGCGSFTRAGGQTGTGRP